MGGLVISGYQASRIWPLRRANNKVNKDVLRPVYSYTTQLNSTSS